MAMDIEKRPFSFNTPTAIQFAKEGNIETWVHTYLNSGDWANPAFSEGLKLQKRWWHGPIELPLSMLQPALGPEPHMEYYVDNAYWQKQTQKLAASFTTLLALPPLIAEYRQGLLSIRDGNHRYGALQIKGWHSCWVIIWYNSAEDYTKHMEELITKS